MNRKNRAFTLVSGLAVFCLLFASVAAAELKVGNSVGNLKFDKTLFPEDQKYLGLDKEGAFTLKDIKAPFVLVEVFSTTCGHCMTQAPILNNLYNLVSKDAKLKDNLKFVAVGAGNDEGPLKMWKVFNKVPFPLIPDTKNVIGKALDIPGTPTTAILDKNGKVVLFHVGTFENAETELKKIKEALKL